MGFDIHKLETTTEIAKTIEAKGTPFGVGVETSGSQTDGAKRLDLGSIKIDPWFLFEKLKESSKKMIVLDEYDAVPKSNQEFHSGVASLMKHLADNCDDCDSRLIVVGIAESAQSLLGEHESIVRSAKEIYLRRLRREDVYEFLESAENELEFCFDGKVRDSLVWGSFGSPFFVHLVGLECIDAMLTRDKDARTVTEDDYEKAIKRAVDQVFRSELSKYSTAVRELSENEKVVIRELVVASVDRVGRKNLLQIVQGKVRMTHEQFNDACLRLQQEHRLIYVTHGRDEVQFADPLMKPFLRVLLIPRSRRIRQARNQMDLFTESGR